MLPVPLSLNIFPLPLLRCSLKLRCRNCVVDMSIEPKHYMVTRFLNFERLWFSVMVSVAKRNFLDEG